jgi:hypothetical protein
MADRKDTSNDSVHLAGAALDRHSHVCALFHDREEEYRVLIPFIAEGFRTGDKAFHIVDPKLRATHLERLQRAGIDVIGAQRTGQLEVRTWEDVQLRDGHFDSGGMDAFIQELLNQGRSQGFPRTRLITHMEWALENRPGVEEFLEYEMRVNRILQKYPDPVL